MDRHILVVDDDPGLTEFLSEYLSDHGYGVTTAANGQAMRRVMGETDVDLIVLDLNLPEESGFDLAREIRAESRVPIIMLTGRDDETDRIVGLEIGADDYVSKPFSARELLARIGAVLRRAVVTVVSNEGPPTKTATFEGWRVDFAAGKLFDPDGDEVRLTTGEYRLLTVFLTHPNRVLSRDQILDMTGGESETFDRAIDIQVMRLRRKIEPVSDKPSFIETARGLGYIFRPSVEWR